MKFCVQIGKGLLFLAGLAVLLWGLSQVMVPKNNTAAAGMEQTRANGILGEPPGTIDIVILGDSEAHTSVSPLLLWRDTGYAAYTCGTDSQKLTYSKTMLERVLQRQRPRVVILETLAIYRRMTAGDVAQGELSRLFPVFRYHNRWKDLTPADLFGRPDYGHREDYKGHRPNKKVDPCEEQDHMQPTAAVEKVPAVNRLYVKMLKTLCDQAGAELLLMSSPSPVNWSYERHNGIQALAEELGCNYLDLNLPGGPDIDWSRDTYDEGDHLNHYGTVKVTAFLGEYFRKRGDLTDHRGESAYRDWDECLKRYEAAVAD